MARVATQGIRGIWRELRQIGMSGRQVWRLVPWRHRWALCGALLVMCLASAGNTAVYIFLGRLVDSVNPARNQGLPPECAPLRCCWFPGADRSGLLGPRIDERAPPLSGGEYLYAHQQRHVRPPDRPPHEGRPIGPGVKTKWVLCTDDSTAAPKGSSGSSGLASSISFPPF